MSDDKKIAVLSGGKRHRVVFYRKCDESFWGGLEIIRK